MKSSLGNRKLIDVYKVVAGQVVLLPTHHDCNDVHTRAKVAKVHPLLAHSSGRIEVKQALVTAVDSDCCFPAIRGGAVIIAYLIADEREAKERSCDI